MGNTTSTPRKTKRETLDDWSPFNPFPFVYSKRPWSSRSQRAVFGRVPGLGNRVRYFQHECDRYWNYDDLDTSLLDAVMTLPKEIRHRIYEILVLSYAPLDQYPKTHPCIEASVNLARRNIKPTFKDILNETRSRYQPRPDVKTRQIPELTPLVWPREEGFWSLFSPSQKREGQAWRNVLGWRPVIHMYGGLGRKRVDTLFKEKCGLLDYFKESEYHNLVEFVKSLERLEKKRISEAIAEGSNSTYNPNSVLKDFMDWFWDCIVIDLNQTWCTKGLELCHGKGKEFFDYWSPVWHSISWFQLRPQYHTSIRHISLDFNIHMAFSTKDSSWMPFHFKASEPDSQVAARSIYDLEASCAYLGERLPNLKSILMYFHFQQETFQIMMDYTNNDWVRAIRQLPAQDKFEVFVGLDWKGNHQERRRERDEQHCKNEAALRLLLMSDLLLEAEEKQALRKAQVKELEKCLDFDFETRLGWLTMHDKENGTFSFEASTFHWVK
ncbi:hypothetical protein EG329_004185 [Mollisiaceae sp. DMI_Dod_QoI]|nr:hypothetical protein EG329_004185 [Helotiales sp. DMI_Dod_QoI]